MVDRTDVENRAADLLRAVGDLAMAIAPHNCDRAQRAVIAAAMRLLVDHIIALANTKEPRP